MSVTAEPGARLLRLKLCLILKLRLWCIADGLADARDGWPQNGHSWLEHTSEIPQLPWYVPIAITQKNRWRCHHPESVYSHESAMPSSPAMSNKLCLGFWILIIIIHIRVP